MNGGAALVAEHRADGTALRADLVELGLRDDAHVGLVVSGTLGIAALSDAARLPSLRSMRAARMETR